MPLLSTSLPQAPSMLSAVTLSFISTHQGIRSSASIEPTKASSVTDMSRNERDLPQRMPGSVEDWSPAGACRVSADKQQQTVWTSQAVCHSHWGQVRFVRGHICETRYPEAEISIIIHAQGHKITVRQWFLAIFAVQRELTVQQQNDQALSLERLAQSGIPPLSSS